MDLETFEDITTRNVHLSVIPDRLYVLKFDIELLPMIMHPLTHVLLMRQDAQRKLFSCTVQTEEVSLIIDETALPAFTQALHKQITLSASNSVASPTMISTSTPLSATAPISMANAPSSSIASSATSHYSHEHALDSINHLMEVSPVSWRAIQACCGQGGSDLSGLLSVMATALANHNISILNLTLFSTDLILVREIDLRRAFACLNKIIENFESKSDLVRKSEDYDSSFGSSPKFGLRDIWSDLGLSLASNLGVAAKSSRCKILCLPKDNLPHCAFALTKALFFSESAEDQRFFSISETDDEISLIVEEEMLHLFPEDSVTVDPRIWIPLKVAKHDDIGFDVCGIVSAMCAPLSLANIQLLNVSTFSTDFTLVAEAELDRALLVFQYDVPA